MGKLKSYIFGFAVGGVAAGVTVLLNAPKPGRELRTEIAQQMNEARIPIKEMQAAVKSVKNNVNDFTEKSLPIIKSTVGEVQTMVQSWKQDIKPNLEKLTEEINTINLPE